MSSRTNRHRIRRLAAAATLTVTAGFVLPSLASAEPAPAAPPVEQAPADPAPEENPLPVALHALRTTPGSDPLAIAAAEAIGGARGSAVNTAETAPLAAYEEGMEFLRRLGVEPFLYPAVAPFCSEDGSLPLGTVPAVAGAVPGPWPNIDVAPLPVDLNVVDPAQTLFAFVPLGLEDDADAAGIQLAWFNINTLQGGFVPMGTMEEAAAQAVPSNIPEPMRPLVETAISRFIGDAVPFGGVRVAPVDTGSGTVLSAIFGTVQNGDASCFFLPTIGIVNVPA